jgi:RNA polymerase sigma-70 factor (ECF subfamily)
MDVEADELATTRLLELAVEGDQAHWATLMTLHIDRLSRLIALRLDRRLQGRIDAADVIQEIHLEAWRHLPDYIRNPSMPFYLWLRGLAGNKLLELHRHHLSTKKRDARRERPSFLMSMPDTTTAAISSLLVDKGTSPSNAAARVELKQQLQNALDGMDAIDREVLVLRHFEHLSPAETAKVLEIEEKAAGMRYLRAIQRLRDVLDKLPGGIDALRP